MCSAEAASCFPPWRKEQKVFGSLPLFLLVLIFVGAAAAVWVAGVRLSDTTDVLSSRLGLGEALGGLIMLAIVTNLPEIAITVSAALSDNLGVAVGNILGGIAIQTVVLVVLDAFGVRGRDPLTYRAASLVLVLEGALVIAVLTVAAAVTLAGGVLLEKSGDAIAGHIVMSGVLFGSTFLAASAALPEVSTGLTSVRLGDYKLAVSDIFGGNAFLPVLFLMASLLSGNAVLPQAQNTDIYLTGLGALLTAVYLCGLIFRPRRRILRMGIDSLVVLVLYTLGIAGLIAAAH